MNFSACIKISFLSLLLLSNISFIQALVTPHNISEEECYNTIMQAALLDPSFKQEVYEAFLQQTLQHLDRFDKRLEDLAFIVSEDSVPTKNKKAHINEIRSLREMITLLRNNTYFKINESELLALMSITQACINHVLQATNQGFYELPFFDINEAQIPHVKPTLEDLEKKLKSNETLVEEFERKADNVGLSWYNRFYRTIKYRVVSPAKLYRLDSLSANLIYSTILTSYLFWQFGGNNWFSNFLRNKLGWPAKTDKFGNLMNDETVINSAPHNTTQFILDHGQELNLQEDQITQLLTMQAQQKSDNPSHPIGLLGRLEFNAYLMTIGSMPLGHYLLNKTSSKWSHLLPSYRSWLHKKGKALDNFLMGGAYKKRSVDGVSYTSNVDFDDMIGNEYAKEWGLMICNYIKNADPLDRAKLTPPKGCLLVGATRTGKSFFVACLLGEITKIIGKDQVGLYTITHSIFEKCGGFEQIALDAKALAPCILFFDEIDLLGLQRSVNPQRTSEFLTHMSGCFTATEPGKEVIILAATNKPENLDTALRQPGRFSQEICFEYPKLEERKLFLEQEFNKRAINIHSLDLNKIAQETEGYSYEALGFLTKKALLHVKLNDMPLSQTLLEKSLDENLRGISPNIHDIPEHQKRLLAAHQAGHALANILLEPHTKFAKVTIKKVKAPIREQYVGTDLFLDENQKPKNVEFGKMFVFHDQDELKIYDREEKIKQCQIHLAGHIAEQIILGECGYDYHHEDSQKARTIAESIASEGLDINTLPKHMQRQVFDQAYALLRDCKQQVTKLLEAHAETLHTITNALQKEQTLDAQQIHEIIKTGEFSSSRNTPKKENSLLKGLLEQQDLPDNIASGAEKKEISA